MEMSLVMVIITYRSGCNQEIQCECRINVILDNCYKIATISVNYIFLISLYT